ncbi:MAG: hypothetical protein GTO55_00930 [Armatimonadetes bacterium]|nr:hypothetical protein [Armatimonadota bacterium]NIM22848.1 hypothetical protein [Armatimonadota bacterium]NIM66714.1 hypothetical protein [Armatimonadota bacterium]NIM75271.1 hypothetical protein [Armatimonadota bacterium]NIN04911.1 hypothetical protein [Armatimonadota bacterium]
MTRYRLSRLLKTSASEVYLIWEGERRIGQVDIHYADSIIHAHMLLEVDLSDEEIMSLCAQIDEDIVTSYLPCFEREEFVITIFRGEEMDSFTYPPPQEDAEEE